MTKDEIKKALECCSNKSASSCKDCPYNDAKFSCAHDEMCKDALNFITEQEKDYSKLQEMFANYQLASDKEIRAQVKQAKIDVLNDVKKRIYDISPYNPLVTKDNVKYFIEKLIEEVENGKDIG